jgi:hypothetical protein
MKTARKPKIIFKYAGDESTEKRKESEKTLEIVYNRLFDIAAKNLQGKRV